MHPLNATICFKVAAAVDASFVKASSEFAQLAFFSQGSLTLCTLLVDHHRHYGESRDLVVKSVRQVLPISRIFPF